MTTIKPVSQLSTSRLLLREWRESDLAPFAQVNADPDVMRYFPAVLDRAQSDKFAARVQDTRPKGLASRSSSRSIGSVASRSSRSQRLATSVRVG